MEYPNELRYSREHEWLRVEGDAGVVGITGFAQDQLGDIVYLDLPAMGSYVSFMEKFGEVESVKAVSDLYSPISGEVVAQNERLADRPELVNQSPYGEGWLIKVKLADPGETKKLLSSDEYRAMVEHASAI